MHIVVDLQGVQSCGLKQKEGKYYLFLVEALIKIKGPHKITLVLNGLLPDYISDIRNFFANTLPHDAIKIWFGPEAIDDDVESNIRTLNKATTCLYEFFIANLAPDIVYFTRVFDGLNGKVFTSLNNAAKKVPAVISIYDPAVLQSADFDESDADLLHQKIDFLKRADLLLFSSETYCKEGVRLLGGQQNALNVGNGVDPQFQNKEIGAQKEEEIRKRYGVTGSFIMYVGPVDDDLSIHQFMQAFALLPKRLLKKCQLLVACDAKSKLRAAFADKAIKMGIPAESLVIRGLIPEQDLAILYKLCEAYVALDEYEQTRANVLDAMTCGTAVIGQKSALLHELVKDESALFDIDQNAEILRTTMRVLTDANYVKQLAGHNAEVAKGFSWEGCAQGLLRAFTLLYKSNQQLLSQYLDMPVLHRPKLAFVSPLPPLSTGIATYSSELLPELSRFYDIDVIVNQDQINDVWIETCTNVRNIDWFLAHSDMYDRVVYQFGNSHFHQHMVDLIKQVPGIVVLHDFYLSGLISHIDHYETRGVLVQELYQSYGYDALSFFAEDPSKAMWKYPCNESVLSQAEGVIVHSNTALEMGKSWLGEAFVQDWDVIPHMKFPVRGKLTKEQAREQLDLPEDAFIVCSFGFLGETKLNQRLLDAWMDSDLCKKNDKSMLIFVGQSSESPYCKDLEASIEDGDYEDRVAITGWIDNEQYHQYLIAADVAVQLRTLSRGESSASVLDCMNYGLPTIVNANGSMGEQPADAVWRLPDEFEDEALTQALDEFWQNESKRQAFSQKAKEVVSITHKPSRCAQMYRQSIEKHYHISRSSTSRLIGKLAQLDGVMKEESKWLQFSKLITQNTIPRTKQLLVDVSALVETDLRTGIQRVVRSVLSELIANPPAGYHIEPVYARTSQPGQYYYARRFTLGFLKCGWIPLEDTPVQINPNDIFLMLDLHWDIVLQQAVFHRRIRELGAKIYTVVYDLLPVLSEEYFPDGKHTKALFHQWLEMITQYTDGAVCISRSVADELMTWLSCFGVEQNKGFHVGWFHLGADVDNSAPTEGLPVQANKTLNLISSRPTFLMVSTIEPRKAHQQVLDAVEHLWKRGVDINLVFVGKQGWVPDSFVQRMRTHKEVGKRFFWLEGISDEYLEQVYENSTCLIAASYGEGFGLPLIEAAKYSLPIIARDIPVFVEVAGEHAYYFSGESSHVLAKAIQEWLDRDMMGKTKQSAAIPYLTWSLSTKQLLSVILNNHWTYHWEPSSHRRINSSSLSTTIGEKVGNSICSTGVAGHLVFGPYISMPIGIHTIKVYGRISPNSLDSVSVDACCEKGTKIFATTQCQQYDHNVIASFVVDIQEPCDDFEVRIVVTADSDVSISHVDIMPAPTGAIVEGKTSQAHLHIDVA